MVPAFLTARVSYSMVYWAAVMFESPWRKPTTRAPPIEAAAERISMEPVTLFIEQMNAREKEWLAA
jgi:hypothetical protein